MFICLMSDVGPSSSYSLLRRSYKKFFNIKISKTTFIPVRNKIKLNKNKP